MVIGLLAITAIPTVTGVAFGISEQRKANTRMQDEKRMAKFYMKVYCEGDSEKAQSLNGMRAVLRNNKISEFATQAYFGQVYLDYADPSRRKLPSHTVAAFFIAYPDDENKPGDGLVSTISDDPPMLNWIYADKDTLELKYGNRTQSLPHIVGHWDWTEDESGVLLKNKELWAAVEEEEGVWRLYYDKNEDALQGIVDADKTIIEISLDRDLVSKPGQGEGDNKT